MDFFLSLIGTFLGSSSDLGENCIEKGVNDESGIKSAST
jgi:hypothetical protein